MSSKEDLIKNLLKQKIKSIKDLDLAKRKLAKDFDIGIIKNAEILKTYRELLNRKKIQKNLDLEKFLKKRAVRTMSGIAPVAVLTKPYKCPGTCAYCPNEKEVPRSYLSNEPAVMRAIRCGYDPYVQVQARLKALEDNGHEPTKIELIVIGGTWSYLPKKYKYWYIANLFAGANNFKSKIKNQKSKYSLKCKITELQKTLLNEQKQNEKAKYKIIGLTLETRPDYINEKELLEMRELGCTRVEIGVQAIDDKILKINKRGHGVKEIADATKLLKDFGFKVTYHLMPGLPGVTAQKDFEIFQQLFDDARFQPDQIKFYPTVVTKGSLLYRWWKQGKYKPYSDKVLQNLIIKCKKIVPEYVRIIRLIRDIPGESIEAGNMITNLRQVMKNQGVECRCIRCREARERELKVESRKLKVIEYGASGGKEYFISAESKDGKILYGFCRLRLADEAIIRELHVYGELVSVGGKNSSTGSKYRKVQHTGLGKLLMQEAEKITKKNKYEKIKVISGVGVRGYYRKLGYKLKNTYMTKNINKIDTA